MDDIFDPPAFNSARKVSQIFQQRPISHSSISGSNGFVPYERERDHLGRLISAKTQPSNTRNVSVRSLKSLPRQYPSFQGTADTTIGRIFRQTQIGAHGDRSSGFKKSKIRSFSSKRLETPAVGHYDAVDIADKMKYHKAREVVFSTIKRSNTQQRKPIEIESKRRIVHYHQFSTEPEKTLELMRGPINYNLPELEKYLQMKKLKMPLNENFEEGHLKFKELARKGLVLAKTIRNAIEFD